MRRHHIDLCACLCVCPTVSKYPLRESVHVSVGMSYSIRPDVSVSVCFPLRVSLRLVHLVQQGLQQSLHELMIYISRQLLEQFHCLACLRLSIPSQYQSTKTPGRTQHTTQNLYRTLRDPRTNTCLLSFLLSKQEPTLQHTLNTRHNRI
jgi:hypothetical protein